MCKLYLVRYPLSHLATLLWLSPSSLYCMLLAKGILVKDEFIWWTAGQDNDEDISESAGSYHHEQMGIKVMEMKDKLDCLLLGEREFDQLPEISVDALSLSNS